MMNQTGPVPPDVLLADPAKVTELDPEAARALLAPLAALVVALALRAAAAPPAQPLGDGAGRNGHAEPERAVRIEEATSLLGMSKDFLYRHWPKLDLGGYRDADGHVKFPVSALRRHIQRQARR